MPHDFGSIGSQNRRSGSKSSAASAAGAASGIGFHELRQALEISTLREDLERLSQGADALRGQVEDAVEQVRDRFAALSAEEMADASAMAPLLQFAVSTLLEVREHVRRLDTRTGPVGDEDRPFWGGMTDARPRPVPVAPMAAEPPEVEASPPPRSAEPAPTPALAPPPVVANGRSRDIPPSDPTPRGEARQPAQPSIPASWLTSESPTSPSAPRPNRGGSAAPPPPGGIDWLGPAGR
ncbi:hypothetical protein [Azospirillum sp.]|uniref:hypothetical protein n=1 Tax=Azospirillum sp. TaxID=34012 RepID=UPI002607A575|nr:hypothetical protein [Azospirillum sp.]